MSHNVTESVALAPHSVEAANLESLIPDQLRTNAQNFLGLIKDYYGFLNQDGQVSEMSIKVPTIGDGAGRNLPFRDLNVSDQNIGVTVTDFTPSGYNQLYKRDEANPDLYVGVIDSSYIITKTVSSLPNDQLRSTWVMANTTQGTTQYGKIDFYDSTYNDDITNGVGSKELSVEDVTFVGNPSGTTTPSGASTTSFRVGRMNMVGLTNAAVPSATTIVTFSDMPVYGGSGSGLTVDITVENARVATIKPNRPGFGYRVGENVRLTNRILDNTVFTVENLQSSPSNITRRILGEHDIDKTSAEFLDRIQAEIATGIPNASLLDRRALYKKIVEYYNTRGSEDSIVSFFKIFFDEVVDISYPKDRLFIPSDNSYQGTSTVSPTKDKYMYKKGSDDRRRIAFYRNKQYLNEKAGTYFIDFEVGENYVLADSTPVGNAENSRTFTPLFAAEGQRRKSVNEFAFTRLADAGMGFSIRDNGELKISGRFGRYQNDISKTFSNYWDTLIPENNRDKKRIRLAITVDIRENDDNKYAADYGSKYAAWDSPEYHIGAAKLSISTIINSDSPPGSIEGEDDGNVFEMDDFHTVGGPVEDTNLYPSALGQAINSGSIGSGGGQGKDYYENANGEVYFYGFAFINRICTTQELQNYARTGAIPSDNILDLDLDNEGNTYFYNRNTTNIIARQVKGDFNSEARYNTLQETNFGLSSTGSEYPRFISWLNSKGFPSDINRLHDGDKYQNFSYVIRTALSANLWKTEFNKLIHPAGLKFFVALYLEADFRVQRRSFEPPRFEWVEKQYLKDIAANNQFEKHSPHYQPGWLEAQFVIPIEIVVYRLLSAFYVLEQAQYNAIYDNYFNSDNGLRIRQQNELSLLGDTKQSRFDTTNFSDTFIEFEGDGTGMKTAGRINENSAFEVSFRLLKDNAVGKYVAGSSWTGTDGHIREMSIRQIMNNAAGERQVEVSITDNAAQYSTADEIHSIKAIADQYTRQHGQKGVYFSDENITFDSGVNNNLRGGTRGHTLVVFRRSDRKVLFNTTYDTYGDINNATTLANKINSYGSGHVIILYSHDATGCNTDLRNALKNCGAGDSTTTWTEQRVPHVFIGIRGGTRGTAIERLPNPLLSSSATQEIPIAICNYEGTSTFTGGDEIFRQPKFKAIPLKVVCPSNDFINLELFSNGKIVEHRGEDDIILRSELEASDPRYFKEINYTGYNWIHHLRDITQGISSANGSGTIYYDETLGGVVSTGNERRLFLDNLIEIEEDAEYEIFITIKNLLKDKKNKIYAGVNSTDSSGSRVGTDAFHSYNYALASGYILGKNEEKTFTKVFSGFNPPNELQYRQTGRSARKFDPGATHFELMVISNYDAGNLDGFSEPYVPTLLIKDIIIKRKDGKVIFDSLADRRDPNYGVKKITTSALPVLDIGGKNGVFRNTMAIGTLQKNSILEGVTSLPQPKPNYIANLYDSFLPFREGRGNFNGFERNGQISENSRELRTDPFNNKAVVWVGKNSGTDNNGDGGFNGPKVSISNPASGSLYRVSLFLKINQSSIDSGRYYFGLNSYSAGGKETPVYYRPNSSRTFKITAVNNSTAGTITIDREQTNPAGAVRIENVVGTTQLNTNINNPMDVVYFRRDSNDRKILRLYSDAEFTTLLDTSAYSEYISGGDVKIVAITNPYFRSGPAESFEPKEKWALFVSYVYTSNYGNYTLDHDLFSDAGIYDVETGKQINTIINIYGLDPAADEIRMRAYQYYNTSSTESEYEWVYPRIDLVDGREPTTEDILNGEAVKNIDNYPSNIRVNKSAVSNGQDGNHVYLFNEGSSTVGEVSSAITTHPDPDDAIVPVTDPPLLERAKVLTPIIKDVSGDNDGELLSRSGISNVRRISEFDRQHITTVNPRPVGIYTVLPEDYTVTRASHNPATDELGSGAEFRVHINESFASVEVVKQGINFEVNDIITIPNSVLGDEGPYPDLQFKVRKTAGGKIEFEEKMDDAVGYKPVYLSRDTRDTDNPAGVRSDGLKIDNEIINPTDDFNWQTDVEYEINFNVTKYLDRNTPANLFIGGGEIGHYESEQIDRGFRPYKVGSVGVSTGNPNARQRAVTSSQGVGPHEVEFKSASEGLCTIELMIDDAEGGIRLALNGHELTVKNSGNKRNMDYRNQTHIEVDDGGSSIDNNPDNLLYVRAAGVYTFESDKLVKGSNTIQIYRRGNAGDGYAVRWLRVLPAGSSNGLIQTGANSHNLIIDPSIENKNIIIEKDASKRTKYNNRTFNYDNIDIKEFHYKLDDIVVRSLRKRVYSSRFEPIVADPPAIRNNIEGGIKFINATDSDESFGTELYRPIDLDSLSAVDGCTSFGAKRLFIPAIEEYDSASGIGQEYVEFEGVRTPILGIPKGNYNVLKLNADKADGHGIIFGGSDRSLPIGTFKANTYYELTAKVFIPSSNTKLTTIFVMAGRNIPSLDKQGKEIKRATTGIYVFELPVGKHQEVKGKYYGWGVYDLEETKVNTQGEWVDIVHSFKTGALDLDEQPKIMFATGLRDDAIRGVAGYGGDAENESFMIRDVRILEGVNPKAFPFKEKTDSKYNAIIKRKNNKDIVIEDNVLSDKTQLTINTSYDESPTTTTYSLRDSHREFGNFELANLVETEPNLIADHVPFVLSEGLDVSIKNPKLFPLGNPYATDDDASPFGTTFENRVITDFTPFYGKEPIWIAENRDNSPSNNSPAGAKYDGGFESSFVKVNPNRTYRCSCWIHQSDTTFGIDDSPLAPGGLKIMGITAKNASGDTIQLSNITDGATSADSPSFFNSYDLGFNTTSADSPSIGVNDDKWYLVVGHIRPFGHVGETDHADSGVYPPSRRGKKERTLINSGDWKFKSNVDKIKLYCTHFANSQQSKNPVKFFAPRIEEINGTEPTISELTSGKVLAENYRHDKIYPVTVASWEDSMHNSRDLLINDDDFRHTILGNTFNVSLNDPYNSQNRSDYLEVVITDKKGIEDTIITITTPSDSRDITIPILDPAGETAQCNIDWGDGSVDAISSGSDSNLTHTYATAGNYTITISGEFYKVSADDKTGAGVTNFKSDVRTFYLGSSPVTEFNKALKDCTGLTSFTTAEGITNTTAVTVFSEVLRGCSSLTSADVSGLNTSNATRMDGMFRDCGTFTITGLYKLDLASLETGASKGLANFLIGSKINTESHERALLTWAGDDSTPDALHYHMGTSNFRIGNEFDSPNDENPTPLVNNAYTKLDIIKRWNITISSGGGFIGD